MLATTFERTALRSLVAAAATRQPHQLPRVPTSIPRSFYHPAASVSVGRNSTTPFSQNGQTPPSVRFLSSTSSYPNGTGATAPQPLVIWVCRDDEEESSSSSSSDSSDDEEESPSLVLIPPDSLKNTIFVDSVEDVVDAVNRRYSSSHFVGGMGEEDPGVWFAQDCDEKIDLLADAKKLELLGTAMDRCRQERHGVPFNVYTSGIDVDAAAVAALKWNSVQVSLWAATPPDYAKCTGRNGPNSDHFGAVCGFIAEASDLGVPVEVGVLKQYAGPARDLALSLGARHVHVYDEIAEF